MRLTMKRRILSQKIGHDVICHLRDGRSLTGILVGVYPDAVALRHGQALMDSGDRVELAGDVVIPSRSLSWMQVDVDSNR